MKCSKAAIHRKTHGIPEIKFEGQRLTSFAGLVVYQSLFSRIGLKQQLAGCSSVSLPRIWSPPILQDFVNLMTGTGLLSYIRI